MRILHIISSGGMYGAEAVILNLSHTLNKGEHRSMLGVFSNSAQPNLQLHESATAEGLESHLILCNGQVDRSVAAALRDLVRRTGAEIVHAHGFKADVYTWFALRASRIPLVSTCHTWYDNDLAVRLYGALDRLVLRKYTGIVAVSDEVKQRLLRAGVRPERIRLIRNGIDLKPFDMAQPSSPARPVSDRPLRIGLVGRLAQEKGIDLFVRAAAGVVAELPTAEFVVVGDGPDRAKLQALMEELGLGRSVTLLGHIRDMPSFYASLDVMVSSSRQEGLPIAILEGMASRLPLVATDVGAVSSVVKNGETGVLVPPGDVGLLQSAILALLRDPPAQTRYGTAGRQLVEEVFSAERMTAEYLELYEQVSRRRPVNPEDRVWRPGEHESAKTGLG